MAVDTLEKSSYEKELGEWIGREKAAIDLINSIGQLNFDHSVELVLFRNSLIDLSVSEILNLHKYAVDFVNQPITIEDTSVLAHEMLTMNLAPAKIDIGKLASEWLKEREMNHTSPSDFLKTHLASFVRHDGDSFEPKDVVLYGFGRIGRLCARELIRRAGAGTQLRLKAIVTRTASETDMVKRAALLRMDSVHGPFRGTVEVDVVKKCLIINGQIIHMIAANKPDEIDYEVYGISDALVIDNTGVWRDRAGLELHTRSNGVSQAMLTAPAKGDVANIVYGVNHTSVDRDVETIFSAASCTTNAIVPILKVVEENMGIENGHIETVHAYTNDQNLLDNYHKNYRRGRSAALNMVITETGAGKAVVKVLPSLEGKLTANAVRVPTPNGSLAIMSLNLKHATTRDEVNRTFKDAALNGDLVEQIKYSIEEELVSTDIIGTSAPAVFDSPATIVSEDGKRVVLYVWYDNEYGYTRQVMRLAKYVSKVNRQTYF